MNLWVFSSPEPKAQSELLVSATVRLSVNFSFKRLLLQNHLTESLGNGDSSLRKSRGWHLLGPNKGQKGVKFSEF